MIYEVLILKKYIKDILRKRYIKESKLLIRYFIIFILKKNKKLQLYINFKILNAIIIKDYILLPLINKLKD